LRRAPFDAGLLSTRPIDNSRVVREVDPRSSRELVGLLVLVAALVGGGLLYAWPHLAARQAVAQTVDLERERTRLAEENRKLKLEKASLEDLQRIEKLARERLGLEPPPPERVVVIERQAEPLPGTRLARGATEAVATN